MLLVEIFMEKNITICSKMLSSTTPFNNLKMKCFFSTKSVYYNDFWRIMWH